LNTKLSYNINIKYHKKIKSEYKLITSLKIQLSNELYILISSTRRKSKMLVVNERAQSIVYDENQARGF